MIEENLENRNLIKAQNFKIPRIVYAEPELEKILEEMSKALEG